MKVPYREQRRQPICPICGYRLGATVDAGIARCPECGNAFEPDELHRERLPGDWTPAEGLRRLSTASFVHAIYAVPMWAGLGWLSSHGSFVDYGGFVVIVAGAIATTWLASRRSVYVAGMRSRIVTGAVMVVNLIYLVAGFGWAATRVSTTSFDVGSFLGMFAIIVPFLAITVFWETWVEH